MACLFCKFRDRCDGAACYYDDVMEQRQSAPDYDVKKWYMVDMCSGCAYTDKVFSKRDIDEHYRKNPEDDINEFMTKEEIEADPTKRWDTEDSWLEDGRKEAEEIIQLRGLETVFGWWKDFDATQLKLKREIGFYNELMKQAEAAGLR